MRTPRKQCVLSALARNFVVMLLIVFAGSSTMFAQFGGPNPIPFPFFFPGNLVVSRSVYVDTKDITAGTTILPPNCSAANCTAANEKSLPWGPAVVGSAYPFVWNNDTVDGSFGITSPIFLDDMTTSGKVINSMELPNSLLRGISAKSDQIVTSFSSKSELALNQSTDGNFLTFMGYLAPVGAIDVSNSNTPGDVDPTNPVGENYYRVVAQIDPFGQIQYTLTNAYSGNNGRAAILNNMRGSNLYYTSGNAGNGSNPQPDGIIIGAGAQIMNPQFKSEAAQNPGQPSPVGSFNITQLGDGADKIGKDTNFRGLTIFNNVIYLTKGSGGNGINTVYFIDTTGNACPSTSATPGAGLPQASPKLPTAGINYVMADLQTEGVVPYNMCILKGFPTLIAKSKSGVSYPFGIWFANSTTLYVADEGSGTVGKTVAGFYTPALPATNTTAGLQKWIFNEAAGEWQLAYTLTNGLNLGVPYAVPNSPSGDVYPTENNSGPGGSGFPWAPALDGLRNITGVVNRDGTVTIYAITSTVSGNGDQGADPNQLVSITDTLSATTAAQVSTEKFTVLRTAAYGEVLRGVAFTPGTPFPTFPDGPEARY